MNLLSYVNIVKYLRHPELDSGSHKYTRLKIYFASFLFFFCCDAKKEKKPGGKKRKNTRTKRQSIRGHP